MDMSDNKKRASELVAKMTLKEKIGQLAQDFYGFNAYTRDENGEIILTEEFKAYVKEYGGLGMLNNYFRSDPWCKRSYSNGGIVLEEREKAYNILQKFMVENTRLGIPVLIEEDAPHGRQVLDSVLYPVSLNVGCSFNPELYEKQCEMIGIESKLGGVSVPYLSIFDIAVEPRWGRTEECFSEDPYLASVLSQSAIRGMNKAGSMVCAKHFAAQGAAQGGHNQGGAVIGERELREIHLPPVEAAVKEGCDFIMAAYNDIDGVPCHVNSYLNNDILRGEFGFDGVLRSDGCAVDMANVHFGDMAKTAAAVVNAGVDCDLWGKCMLHLDEAVEKGYIKESVIDRAVVRLLEKKFKCGIMDNPFIEEDCKSAEFINSGKPQEIAYQMATESLVLLKNENNILPLKQDTKILLIGGNLDNIYFILGDYTSEQKNQVTIKEKFTSNGAEFLSGWDFEKGIVVEDEEIKIAVQKADVIVFGFGGSSVRDFESIYNGAGAIERTKVYMDCGEGLDLAQLKLTDCQYELFDKLVGLGKPIISLGIAGRPYIINEICEKSDAVIWCGYPGQKGADAIWDTLIGKVNNFGRLSISFPKSAAQLPVYYNRKQKRPYVDIDANPLFTFGYGLSYSEFAYNDISIKLCSLDDIKNGKKITVEGKVKNISNIKGKAVPQLYIKRTGGTISHRPLELKGFSKIELAPGEEKVFTFELGYDALKEWSVNNKYELGNIHILLLIGESSDKMVFADEFDIM